MRRDLVSIKFVAMDGLLDAARSDPRHRCSEWIRTCPQDASRLALKRLDHEGCDLVGHCGAEGGVYGVYKLKGDTEMDRCQGTVRVDSLAGVIVHVVTRLLKTEEFSATGVTADAGTDPGNWDTASPLMASTMPRDGTQQRALVYVSWRPPQPTERSACTGQRLPDSPSGSDQRVTWEALQ